jgi:hypothetical protein
MSLLPQEHPHWNLRVRSGLRILSSSMRCASAAAVIAGVHYSDFEEIPPANSVCSANSGGIRTSSLGLRIDLLFTVKPYLAAYPVGGVLRGTSAGFERASSPQGFRLGAGVWLIHFAKSGVFDLLSDPKFLESNTLYRRLLFSVIWSIMSGVCDSEVQAKSKTSCSRIPLCQHGHQCRT